MGDAGLPKIFIDDAAETPDAKKWNDNFSFLNLAQDNRIKNGDVENFTGTLPDFWALSGTGAASAIDVDSKHGSKAVKITFGSAPAILKQSSIEFKFFKGRKTKAWAFVKTSTPSQARIIISDGVGSTSSSFHTGSGNYEILEVTHQMAAGATEWTMELHVESGGSAIFDAMVLVDFEEIRSFIRNLEDLGRPTRETFTSVPGNTDILGNYAVMQIGSAGSANFSFRIPHDFVSLVSASVVAIPVSTGGPQTVELTTDIAAAGEDATATSETDLTNVYNYTANQMQELDISSVLTGIAANDYVGLLFDRQGAGFGNLQVLGIRLRYN